MSDCVNQINKSDLRHALMRGDDEGSDESRSELLWTYYSWLLNGPQRGKVLVVLTGIMTTGMIRDSVRKQFSGNVITRRSIKRIMDDLIAAGLAREICEEATIAGRKIFARVYAPTPLGVQLQKHIQANNLSV